MSVKSRKTPRSLDASALRNCLLEIRVLLDPIDLAGPNQAQIRAKSSNIFVAPQIRTHRLGTFCLVAEDLAVSLGCHGLTGWPTDDL